MTGLGDTIGPAPMRNHSSTTSTKADSFRRIEVITGVGRRRRWTDEEKAWIVAESLNGVEPLAWLTDVLERMVSGRTKAHELERLLPWAWKAEQLEAAVHA
jgi:transposase-like protein